MIKYIYDTLISLLPIVLALVLSTILMDIDIFTTLHAMEPEDESDEIPDTPDHLKDHDLNSSEDWTTADQELLDHLQDKHEVISEIEESDAPRYLEIDAKVKTNTTLTEEESEFYEGHKATLAEIEEISDDILNLIEKKTSVESKKD